MSPVYTYTYNNTVSATTASISADPRVIELDLVMWPLFW